MIIKCPECGRQVSEKAPTCPSCGVEIAGKIIRCHNCGEIYFIEDGVCPACHQPAQQVIARTTAPKAPMSAAPKAPMGVAPKTPMGGVAPQPKMGAQADGEQPSTEPQTPEQKPETKGRKTFLAAIFFSVIVCGVLFAFYFNAQSNKEEEEYEFALRSTDPEVLQSYLLRFTDAPEEHLDSIKAHLDRLQKGDEEWQNAVLSNSRAQLQAYIDNNPESVHRQEALNKIDSLDWVAAQKSNDITAITEYQKQHPDGRYIDEASILLSKMKTTTVMPEEKSMVQAVFRQFFQSINSRNESRLTETVGMVLNTFLGKANATSDDVITFLHKIYKDDITNMNWRIDADSYNISKQEVSEDEYEYTVTFNAKQDVERADGQESFTYRITAIVSNNGKIIDFNLSRLN